MATRVITTNLTDKKAIFNAIEGNSKSFKDMADNVIDCVGYVVYIKGDEEEGEEEEIVTSFKLTDGTYVGGNSRTVKRALYSYLSTFGEWKEGEVVSFKITKSPGKRGDFCGIEVQ